MNEFIGKDIIELSPVQEKAVLTRGKNLIVTAGAGSGKTRTLVARYISLLGDGIQPNQLLAITFTEKAAREMRNRVRRSLSELRLKATSESKQELWGKYESQMDSARIGTIHSLCAEILRTHPAEVGVDPEFEVLDEGITAALQVEVVQDTLSWAIDQKEIRPLFKAFEVYSLERLVGFALTRRLDLDEYLQHRDILPDGYSIIQNSLEDFINSAEVRGAIQDFHSMQADGSLLSDAGDKLTQQIENLLSGWTEVETDLAEGDTLQAVQGLYRLRQNCMALNIGGNASSAKQVLRELREVYDRQIKSWLLEPPDPIVESVYMDTAPILIQLFKHAHQVYRSRLAERGALDFDDLEAYALYLLKRGAISSHWQGEIQAVLVDEFQDTNQRQREIIEAISGPIPGRLFVVGDERQSIYRFRGADVTVFRDMQVHIENRSGESIEIEHTFRAHEALGKTTGELLQPAMQPDQDPIPAYWVPFSSLEAERKEPRPGMKAPHVELIIGMGENAATGRKAAAKALTKRLVMLKDNGQIQAWDDVALLFRASIGFSPYEDALEEAGIPYVTAAGRGFYDRPEIRDVLNILHALADPWDDLALAGLLRSPAFGLKDGSLYKMRWNKGKRTPQSLYLALAGDLSQLDEDEKACAKRALEFLNELTPLTDRLPVAELLKRAIDRSNYRAILATSRSRLWRNLDKLLEDAHASRLISVRAFLEYLKTLKDVGAREGEAPVEAEGSLQLLTVHKSKGLEFNIVVIADAAYRGIHRSEIVYLMPKIGMGFKPDRLESSPLVYNFIKHLDQHQDRAEEKRLLYVAATRAKEKLIINGHLSKLKPAGWLKELAAAAEINLGEAAEEAGMWVEKGLPDGGSVAAWVMPTDERVSSQPPLDASVDLLPDSHLGKGAALYLPIVVPEELQPKKGVEEITGDELIRPWRATGSTHAPSTVVGKMVHRAIQRWLFPGDAGLERLLHTITLNKGLVGDLQQAQAIKEAIKLLQRLRTHPLWSEIDTASGRHHEVPFVHQENIGPDSGYIDLLYLKPNGWNLVDFKTDEIHSKEGLEEAIARYQPQIRRYIRAVRSQLGQDPIVRLCFLDYQGKITLKDI